MTTRPQLDMFGGGGSDGGARGDIVHPAAADNDALAIAAAVPRRIHIGTSSWSFPGWAGIVYDREYTEKQLAHSGLHAYAQHPLLTAVGIDRSYYAPLTSDVYAMYASEVPENFRFLIKAERLLVLPDIDDSRGGSVPNARFLDPDYATEMVVQPIIAGMGGKAGPILFQFSPMHPRRVGGPRAFADALGEFLRALPVGPLYAVELRTPELFTTSYFDALASAGAVHGYTVHGSMLPLPEQLRMLPVTSQRALVLRWMLHTRFGYSEARAAYAPFNRVVDPDDATRDAIVAAAIAAADESKEAYVVINNKAEGSSPLSAFAVADRIVRAAR